MQPLHVLITHRAYNYSPEKYNYGCICTKCVLCTWHSYTTIWTPGNFFPFSFLRKGWREKQRGECLIWDSRPAPTQLSDRISARTQSPFICWFCAWGLHLLHMAPAHLDHLSVSIAVRKSYICQPVGFFQVFEISELSLREVSWGEQQNQHLTPIWSLWHCLSGSLMNWALHISTKQRLIFPLCLECSTIVIRYQTLIAGKSLFCIYR